MYCKTCHNICIRNGFQSNGTQRYYCNSCKKSQPAQYRYKAYSKNTDKRIYLLITNSCGFNDISRILSISKNTVKKRLFKLSKQIKRPTHNIYNQNYEIDEMYVKVKGMNRNCWVTYAINRKTKHVVDFYVGKRGTEYIVNVVNKVLLLYPKKVYTDHWGAYKKLIPNAIHKIGKTFTNCIERHHLNLRTHLKCLSRKTICYAKCIKTLKAIVKLYFWGNTLNFKYV